ncbi:tetratricopeptide repeat protein [Leptolyngbya sp. PCC 6406]|uniref:tetratricopeptide repeat protein n=1 Tax=Leptolyngbya sp. PCC 6406 TaxID=1173264 RepID=UPI0002AC3D4F|nr:tetratricopeptide repeat protein [Leptolyngbya sp. PCC 6406]
MKVVQETSSHLTLQLRPWFLWLLGSIFGVAGLLPSLFLGSQSLLCDRNPPPGQCELTQTTLLRKQSQTWPLAELQGAEVNVSSGSDGSPTYQVILRTREDSIPLSSYSSSGEERHRQQAADINQFLQDSAQPQLLIQHNDAWFGLLFVGIFTGVALVIILVFGQIVTVDLDKLANQFTLTQRGVLGVKRIEHPLRAIVSTRIESSRNSKGSTTYRLSLVLNSGEVIPLTPYYSSGYDEKQRTGERISTFLGLAPPSTNSEHPLVPNFKDLFTLVTGGTAKREHAIATYRDRLQANPEDMDAHTQLALVLIMQGEKTEARNHLTAARRQFLAEGKTDLSNQITALIAQVDTQDN